VLAHKDGHGNHKEGGQRCCQNLGSRRLHSFQSSRLSHVVLTWGPLRIIDCEYSVFKSRGAQIAFSLFPACRSAAVLGQL